MLRDIEVSEVGMGCMAFSHGYGKIPTEEYSIEAIRNSFEHGCTFFDTAEVYSPGLSGIGHNELIVGKALKGELVPEDPNIEEREMKLRKMVLSRSCAFLGKTLGESGIRDRYSCMVVGVEEGQQNLTMISPSRKFVVGDIIWVVGERRSLEMLAEANNGHKTE